jgi:phage regulator Rha-like protein
MVQKTINLAVKRNINRFPNDFYFQLNNDECSRFQFETLNKRGKNIKYLPYVFTEQGVSMLASVLHTEIAEQMSVRIMRTFVKMRKYISNNLIEQRYIKCHFATYNFT